MNKILRKLIMKIKTKSLCQRKKPETSINLLMKILSKLARWKKNGLNYFPSTLNSGRNKVET